jgi:DNA-binding beta-propeller fold protein YncE
MRILPTATVVMVADTIQWDLTDLIVDARRDRVYVLQMLPRRVAAYSMTTLALVGTAALSGTPRDMDITPGGDSLLVTVAGSGTLAVIDLLQATLSAVEIPLVLDPALSQYPDGVAALADGRALIALGSFQGLPGNHMHEIDLRTGAQRSRPDVSANGIIEGTGMARSDDGRRVVVQSGVGLRIYDLASDAFGPVQGTRGFSNVSLNVDGSRIAVGLALHDGALAFQRDADALPGQELTASRLSPSGGALVHAWRDRGIMWSTTNDGRILHRLTIPYPVTQMRFTPDERVLIGAGSFPGAQQSVLIRYELP